MKRIILLLILCLVVFACENFDDTRNSRPITQFNQNFGQTVQRDFMGQVVDEYDNPIVNALIKIGSNQVYTDSNGVFILKNVNVYEKFAHIKVEKIGFLDGSRSLVPTEGMNQIKIMMIANVPIATINSNELSEVILSNGTKINFDGFFEDENGNTYSGVVSVFVYHLEASNSNLNELMPGMLFAEAEDGSAKVLQTFGMLNVELRGTSGQKLQIAKEHTAKISMKIDATQLTTATASIPLWHFDETNGYWKEEGEAIRQGDYYVGNVSHFSWWNCDAYVDVVYLKINLVDSENNPIPNLGITLTDQSGFVSCISYTDQSGLVSGIIPKDNVLTLSSNGAIIFNQLIGSFSNNSSITVEIESPTINIFNFNGNVLDCDNNFLSNSYLISIIDGYASYIPVINGMFLFTHLTFQNTINYSVSAVNFVQNEFSSVISNQATNGVSNTISLNNMIVCNSSYYNLSGNYNLVVTRDDGAVYNFPNEEIIQVAPFEYKTSTTGHYAFGSINSNQGYTFLISSLDGIIIPNQGLFQGLYTNQVSGVILDNNSSHGTIISNDEFYTNYSILFSNNLRTYTCHYTRN